MSIAKLYRKAPYIYFVAICFSMAIPGIIYGNYASITFVCIGLIFVYPLLKEKMVLNQILGIVTVLWSIFMSLAYFSDVAKMNDVNSTKALNFVIGGAIFITLNFWMSWKLILNGLDPNAFKTRITASSAA